MKFESDFQVLSVELWTDITALDFCLKEVARPETVLHVLKKVLPVHGDKEREVSFFRQLSDHGQVVV